MIKKHFRVHYVGTAPTSGTEDSRVRHLDAGEYAVEIQLLVDFQVTREFGKIASVINDRLSNTV